MTQTVHVLDCTFRDGGYYNDWNFSPALASAYLQAVSAAGVDCIEIGFRSVPQNRFLGAFAYSTDDFLENLGLPKMSHIAVMVNAKEILGYEGGAVKGIDALFQEKSRSPVDLVRVATHFAELANCRGFVARLKEKGYSVAMNLMQASGKSAAELTDAAAVVKGWGTVDILYLADSLGNMDPEMTRNAIAAVARGWDGPTGIHTHNNLGQALPNSVAALSAGAKWLDATVLGMGRGAGNTPTEYLLLELKRRGIGSYYPDALFSLVIEPFEALRQQYGWGPNLLYYLSGTFGIHPTYVQEMLGKGRYTTHHILSALEFLKNSGGNAYSLDHLSRAIHSNNGDYEGSWSAEGWASNRPFLIVGPGPGTREHLDALCRFIDKRNPVVVCLNTSELLPPDKVTAYAACHKTRLLMDAEKYRFLRKPLISPLGTVPDIVRDKLKSVDVFDYGMRIQSDTFEAGPTSCVLPSSLVAAYVMALAEAAGASKLLLAGFDGYGSSDPRQAEMAHVFHCYQARPGARPLMAITPTTYDIPQSSVYSPIL